MFIMLLLIYIIEKLEKTIIKFSEFFLIKFFKKKLNKNFYFLIFLNFF